MLATDFAIHFDTRIGSTRFGAPGQQVKICLPSPKNRTWERVLQFPGGDTTRPTINELVICDMTMRDTSAAEKLSVVVSHDGHCISCNPHKSPVGPSKV